MENSGTFDAVLEHDLGFLITVLRLCSALPQLRSVGINLLRLASISWAQPKIIEHGLSLGHFAEHGLKFGISWSSALPQVVSAVPQLRSVGINFLSTTKDYWARSQIVLILLSTVSNLASGWHQHCLRWSPHYLNCFEWHRFSEHDKIWLSTVSLWPQVGISIASGGLRIASIALSGINFLSTNIFGWARSQIGLRLASALPQMVSALHQLPWVTSFFWTRPNLAEHGLTLASCWHQLSLSIASSDQKSLV